jgi:hypothetical protein
LDLERQRIKKNSFIVDLRRCTDKKARDCSIKLSTTVSNDVDYQDNPSHACVIFVDKARSLTVDWSYIVFNPIPKTKSCVVV